jgi:hypothetical protein
VHCVVVIAAHDLACPGIVVGDGLRLRLDQAEVVFQRPGGHRLVKRIAVRALVGQADYREVMLGNNEELAELTVARAAVADGAHAGDVLDEPADADGVAEA